MVSEKTGLGFHSKKALAFKRYLADQAPEEVREAIKALGLPWYSLYPRIIESYRGLKNTGSPLTGTDLELVRVWQRLLADREAFLRYAPTVYRRLLIAGVDLACHRLIDVYEQEGSEGLYKALNSAFPDLNHSSRFLHQEFARLVQSRVFKKVRGRKAIEKKHEDQTYKTKKVVIEQWEKFSRSKATAATFANHFCGGADAGAKPRCFHDVMTGDPLPVTPVSNRTVRNYINEHRKKR